ncbi:MAG: pyrroline-5-carboxylate reductase [Micrococcales bacterium]|nr:pyrroline-5-carboxylate reductase [Micrococcales bacterium]MCL2667315.1 pyrroline-5-carboxylate reductase [Micrococcales bacterium]
MADKAFDGRVVVIGAGVMGSALTRAVRATKPDEIVVVEPDPARRASMAATGVSVHDELGDALTGAQVVVLAVKPPVVPEVLVQVSKDLDPGATVVSVAAGVPLAVYEKVLPGTPVVRVMPNTPILVGKGVCALAAGTAATEEHLALVEQLLAATGLVVRVAEPELDAVTAVSGSGPAYGFYLIDAMAEAGVLLGLSRELALRLAAATVEGAGALAVRSKGHPAVLRERVSSPGGTTVAAVAELDARAVRAAVVAAARAAHTRSVELGQDT